MAVNSYLIYEKLESCFYKNMDKYTTDCGIRYVTIYNPLISMNENTAYILVDPKMFPEDRTTVKCLLIVLGEISQNNLKNTQHDVICVNKEYSLGKLYENVQNIIEYYNQWEMDMTNSLMNNESLDKLCSVSVPYFGNPLTVQNAMYEIIGVGETAEIAYPYKFREKDSDFLSDKWVKSAIDSDKNIFDIKVPFKFNYIKDHLSLLMNIFDEEEYKAQICVDANHRELVIGDYIRICILKKYVAQYFKRNPKSVHNYGDQFSKQIREYFLGKDNKDALAVSLNKRRWKTSDNYLCCVYKQKNDESYVENNGYISKSLVERMPDCVSFANDTEIYAIYNIGKDYVISDKKLNEIQHFASEFKLKVGISMTFDKFFSCKSYFKQACSVINMNNKKSKSEIYQFMDYKLQYVIMYGVNSLPLESLIPRGLKNLMKYDKENDSDFYITLEMYLKKNMNVTETVNELFIHRSTFKYRLQRIKEIMETELDNYEEQMYIEMLLYEIDMRNEYANCKIC